MSNLFVDKISGKSGTSSGAPITLSGDTATLSSGVTGIPAAGITGTLGSGVFPAGHVIGISTLINFARYTGSDISTTSQVFVDLGYQVSITPKFASSSSILRMNLRTSGWGGTSANQQYYTTFCRDTDSGTTIYDTANDCSLGVTTGLIYAGSDTTRGTSFALYTNRSTIDSKSHSAGTPYFYRVFWRTHSGNAIRITSQFAELFFYVEEIKI